PTEAVVHERSSSAWTGPSGVNVARWLMRRLSSPRFLTGGVVTNRASTANKPARVPARSIGRYSLEGATARISQGTTQAVRREGAHHSGDSQTSLEGIILSLVVFSPNAPLYERRPLPSRTEQSGVTLSFR